MRFATHIHRIYRTIARLLLAGAAALLAVAPATAAPLRQTTGSITGRVDGFNGHTPLANASVKAYNPAGEVTAQTLTDDAGQYTLAALPPGDYRLRAGAADHVHEFYNNAYTWDSAAVVQVVGGQSETIDFVLDTAGKIHGRVMREPGGAALPEAWVEAIFPGRGVVSTALSDAAGEYTLSNLPAGELIVRASLDGYIPEYYQDHAEPEDADPVHVAAMETTSAIDLSLTRTPTLYLPLARR